MGGIYLGFTQDFQKLKLYGSAINQQILLVCLYGEIQWAEIANFGGE